MADYIVEIAGHDAKWFTQAQILEKIRASANTLDLKIITPMTYQKPVRNENCYATVKLVFNIKMEQIVIRTFFSSDRLQQI